jgi:plasmid stabilization system protein ParE
VTRYRLRLTPEAESDLARLFEFLAEKDVEAAERALATIRKAFDAMKTLPFMARKAEPDDPYLRECVISFGSAGYVALFRISERHVTVLAVRHQREDDYH